MTIELLLCISYPLAFVGMIHYFDFNGKNRNDTSSIKKRAAGVIFGTIYSILSTALYQILYEDKSVSQALQSMGLTVNAKALVSSVCSLILHMTLFLGPLTVEIGNHLRYYKHYKSLSDFLYYQCGLASAFGMNWKKARDILIAPITEELVFRSCAITMLRHYYNDYKFLLWYSPLIFSLSHLHHLYNFIVMKEKGATQLLLIVGLQAIYTYVFGVMSAFVFLNTGFVWSCIAAHMFCNWIGFPDIDEVFNEKDLRLKSFYTIVYFVGLFAYFRLRYTLTDINDYFDE